MKTLRLFTHIFFVFGVLLISTSASAERLDLSEGAMTIGGRLAFEIKANDISNVLPMERKMPIILEGGYFIFDNWEVDVSLGTTLVFNVPIEAAVNLGLGTKFYFDTDSMFYPYIATLPTVIWNGAGLVSNWSIRLPVMAGILVGLNSHVALDVGATAGFTWQLNSGTSPTGFDLAVGYVGVRSFF